MKEITLFSIDTPYREPLSVKGWHFGNPDKKSLAVIGALRGNEVQQMYICSQLIQKLTALEENGEIDNNAGILVIPCANQFSMNVGKRFWAADNSDINRMFPGYDQGETTQRIADKIFRELQGFTYGVHVASIALRGNPAAHIRIMHTGYEDETQAKDFGLPYILIRKPQPYDTTTLNYNWQIWNTTAFSLYSESTDRIDEASCQTAVNAILRFASFKELVHGSYPALCDKPRIVRESLLHNIICENGGILRPAVRLSQHVEKNSELGRIVDPFTGCIKETVTSDCDGDVMFMFKEDLISGKEIAFRVLPDNLED